MNRISKLFTFTLLLLVMLAPASAALAQDEPVTLVLWHAWQDAEGEGLISLIDAFQTANPNITIDAVYQPSGTIQDSFVAAAGSGEGPDMIIWANDSTGPWASAGLLLDISGMIDDELMGQVSETGWGTFTFQGGIYGFPEGGKTLAFFYNKSLVPDAPETWQDVLDISAELAMDGFTGLGFQNGFFHSAGFLFSLNGSLMDEEGNATFGPEGEGREAMIEYLAFHKNMYELGQSPDETGIIVSGDSPLPQFQTGEAAMVYDGIWNLAQFTQDLGDDLGVAVMPKLDNGEVPALFAQTTGFFAGAALGEEGSEAKLDAFLTWAKFATSQEGQQILMDEAGHLPVNPAVEVADPHLQTFAEQFAMGTPFPNREELSAFWGPMGDAIAAVGQGGEEPEAATDEAYALIQASIDEIHAAE